jgi:hypothetical protein
MNQDPPPIGKPAFGHESLSGAALLGSLGSTGSYPGPGGGRRRPSEAGI